MHPIHFAFTPTYNDYVTTSRAYVLRQPVTLLLVLGAGLLSVGFSAFAAANFNSLISLLPVIAVPLILVALYVIVTPLLIASRAQGNKQLLAAMSCEASPAGIRVRSQFVDTTLDWRLFRDVIETRRYFLLVFHDGKKMFQMAPKRAFASEQDVDAFREMAALAKSKT
jgi:hypothetical protein